MKKLTTDSKHFGALRMLDDFVQSLDLGLSDQTAPEEFIKKLAGAIQQHRANPTILHGFRAQTMFAYLAAALGGCKIITEEDSGDLYVADSSLKRPDFRILTDEAKEFFVEAKNFNPTDHMKPFVLRADYARSLLRYAEAFQRPLLFAIHWVRWNLWTLTPFANFSLSDEKYSIELTEAMKYDEKALLGDCMIGIPKPLSLRFYTDPTKPRKVAPDGNAQFTIGRVAFVAAGREIVDAFEKKLAGFFLYYGPWEQVDNLAHIVDDEIVYFEILGTRQDPNPDMPFLLLGDLSDMISRQFNEMTTQNGEVMRLTPQVQPDELGIVIPKEFKGNVLGIWRFKKQSSKFALEAEHQPT